MELLLEAFVLFSCLMFWVVFFHKKGTLAKLKKIEASIQSKISILEDLASKYPALAQDTNVVPSPQQPLSAVTPHSVVAPKMTSVGSSEEVAPPFFSKENMLNKIVDSANIFEQKIESMLKNHDSKVAVKVTPPAAGSSITHQQVDASTTKAMFFEKLMNAEEDVDLEHAMEEDKVFQKQTQVAVPRTQPIESFQDVINLSKALEQEQSAKG